MTSRKSQILVIDDDREVRTLLTEYFNHSGYEALSASSGIQPLQQLREHEIHPVVIVSDISMPQLDGLSFVKEVKKTHPDIPIILITAHGTIESAIQAMRVGAYDYIMKPFKLADVQVKVEKAIDYFNLKKDNSVLRQEIKGRWQKGKLIGKSSSMKAVFDLVERVAHATSNILITGESGTGKEVIARSIHDSGSRSEKPFVAINCTAIPENLLESELFGHAKGSFTGAYHRKRGLFEEANEGTIFLDEIGDMDLSLQSKLLRVLQERKIRSVGDNVDRKIDVRVIAATNKDLKIAIQEGRFREDLYYRLSVIPIHIPPLRQRQEDVPILAEHFLKKYAATSGSKVKGFTEDAMRMLMQQSWQGNVRELENVVERSLVFCRSDRISENDLRLFSEVTTSSVKNGEPLSEKPVQDLPSLEDVERSYIRYVLKRVGGQKSKAARVLGVNRRTLYRKEQDAPLMEGKDPAHFNFHQAVH